jgi:hypothetical protein
MSLTHQQRARLAELADVLIPAVGGYASASQADVGGRGLDLVLAARPDFLESLLEVLHRAGDSQGVDAVATLRETAASSFAVLAEFAASAYFMNPDVLKSLGYDGQTARPIDPTPDYLEDGLLDAVIQRGPIYRPTPQSDA